MTSNSYQQPSLLTSVRKNIRELVFKSPQLARLYYKMTFSRPVLPHWVGNNYYRETSSWELKPHLCPCDVDFIKYLEQQQIQNQTIFHFGTGSHHILGLENQNLSDPNQILGITASVLEHQKYVNLCQENRYLNKYYKVLFADIYTLTADVLPMFDIVSLFHLGEFYLPEEADFIHHNDQSLIEMFLSKLNPGGRILFYPGSVGWGKVVEYIEKCEYDGKIHKVAEYNSLLVYQK